MDNWETLFDQAMTCLQSILITGAPMPDWTFGGGTALMLRYHHRNSQDKSLSSGSAMAPRFVARTE